jgi:hypothetical protein
MYAASKEISFENSENPNEFLAWTLNLYIKPGVRSVAVNYVNKTPDLRVT